MDKFEYELKVEQIEKLIRRGDYITAKKIADGMDWKKEKDTRLLRNVAELYVQAGEDEKALYFLRQAYNASPRGVMILERMINVALGSDNLDVAEEFCDAYGKVAPDSSEYALFRYKIAVEKQASATELIKWLKLYTNREMDEEYCYKLAELYEEINDRAACIKQCDYIIDFFCFGEYVEKAAALKEKFAELDEYQARRINQREDYEKEYKEYIKENNHRQKRQAREEAAEKQIIEAQLLEKQEAQLGEQISEIVEAQKKEQEEIHLDTLVMDEILQAEKALAEELNQENDDADAEAEIQKEEPSETVEADETESEAESDEEEDKTPAGGFWAGIKSMLKKQGQITEEAEQFEKVKNELQEELQDATDELWKNIEEAEAEKKEEESKSVEETESNSDSDWEVSDEWSNKEDTKEEVKEEPVEVDEEKTEEEEVEDPAEETVEETTEEPVEEPEDATEEAVEETEEEAEEEVEEEAAVEAEEEAVEETTEEAEEEAVEETAEEVVEETVEESVEETEDEAAEETKEESEFDEPQEKAAPKRRIRRKEQKEEGEESGEEHYLEAPEASFMVSCMDMDAGVKYALEMVRRMDRDIRFETIGKITAREVNKVKFGVIREKFNQDAMLIMGAGELTQGAADNIYKWMKADENNCVILVDSSQHLADLERRSPKLMRMIKAQYDYQIIDKEDWINMIEQKAKAEGVVLDDDAYELFDKYLDEKITRGEVIVGQDLDDALYEAIERAESFSIGGLISGIMATRYDEDGMLIIKDKHFS